MKKATALAVGAFVLGGLVAATALFPRTAPEQTRNVLTVAIAPAHPAWTEVAWPFPMDQWGKGKAFRCSATDCGTEVNLYLRAKIGFCNCATGVSDDEELDRISDYDLIGNKLSALAPGEPIKIAWMNGRSRTFSIGGPQPAGQSAISVGFNDRCDAMIATVVVGHGQPATLEPSVIAFLNSDRVLKWAEVTLGL
jgi:hypothetical protein